jgi:CDP-diacylglycerol--serine O-phosphatidyltransferase
MRLKRVSVLASLFTLGNALCGFAAITLTTKALQVSDAAHAVFSNDIKLAGYFIIAAMVFDAVDGRLARFARATSDFGGQLDSLADAISFGLAPAFLMNRVVVEGLSDCLTPVGLVDLLKAVWVCGAIYLGCALIRLARFNVENVHEEEAHMSFKGLPSPAAAGAVVSLIIVLANFWTETAPGCTACVILWALPPATVFFGLLMVSNVRYSHMLNQFIRGRRPVGHLVLVVLCLALAFVLREIILPVGFGGYALSGPVLAVYRRIRGGRAAKAGDRAGGIGPSSPQPPPHAGEK